MKTVAVKYVFSTSDGPTMMSVGHVLFEYEGGIYGLVDPLELIGSGPHGALVVGDTLYVEPFGDGTLDVRNDPHQDPAVARREFDAGSVSETTAKFMSKSYDENTFDAKAFIEQTIMPPGREEEKQEILKTFEIRQIDE